MTRYKTKTQKNWERKQQAFKATLRCCNAVAREEYPCAQISVSSLAYSSNASR